MRNRPWLLVILACLALVLVLGFIKFTQIRAAIAFGESFPEPSETVQTVVVEFAPWQARMVVVGDVRASREVELYNELPGVIAAVGFASGGLVKEGDLLLQLDVSEETAQLQGARAELDLAKVNYERFAGFKNPDAVSRQQVDQAKAQLAMAQGRVGEIQSVIDRKTLRAPFTAHSSIHQFEVGQFLAANSWITRLVGENSDVWIDFAVPQQYASINVGATVLVSTAAKPNANTQARVIAVESGISRASRSVSVRAKIAAGEVPFEGSLKPGTIVSVSVPISDAIQAVTLPSSAVRVDTFGPYVFVLDRADDDKLRASRRPVTVASKEAELSVITQGLEAGQLVASQGAFKLREGIWVKTAAGTEHGQ